MPIYICTNMLIDRRCSRKFSPAVDQHAPGLFRIETAAGQPFQGGPREIVDLCEEPVAVAVDVAVAVAVAFDVLPRLRRHVASA
jgi:hypothetical protein